MYEVILMIEARIFFDRQEDTMAFTTSEKAAQDGARPNGSAFIVK